MGMFEAYKTCITKYATFQGRARRSEYWYFTLCNVLIYIFLGVLASTSVISFSLGVLNVSSALLIVYELFILLPSISVMVRRLHDTSHSGGFAFLSLVPLVGVIILFIWYCEDSYPGTNQYGENPKVIDQTYGYDAGRNHLESPAQRQIGVPTPKKIPNTVLSSEDLVSGNRHKEAVGLDKKKTMQVVCIKGTARGKSASGEVVYIGRDPQLCQMVFPDGTPGVSRTHCMVHLASGSKYVELKDLNSSYGTFLPDGTRVTPNVAARLKSGDSFFVGSHENMISVSF